MRAYTGNSPFRTVVSNVWVTPFHRGHLRSSENTDIYIIIHNSSKEVAAKIILWLGDGDHDNMRNYIKGLKH